MADTAQQGFRVVDENRICTNGLNQVQLPALLGHDAPDVSGGVPMQVKPCYRTAKNGATCQICSFKKKDMHMPTGHVGRFCSQCCPACVNGSKRSEE